MLGELPHVTVVDLVAEPTNLHDAEAVAIFFKGKKLGYVPSAKNSLISRLIYFGHGEILEARIQMSDLSSHPERQFCVVVKLKDARSKI